MITTLTLTRPAAVLFTLSARSLNDVRDAIARGPVEVTAFSQDNMRLEHGQASPDRQYHRSGERHHAHESDVRQ